jgi:hypothetical protein
MDDRVTPVRSKLIRPRGKEDIGLAVSRLGEELARITHLLGRYRLTIGAVSASGPVDANSDPVDPTGSGVLWLATDGSTAFFDVPPSAADVSAGTATYEWVELFGSAFRGPIGDGKLDTTDFDGVLSSSDDTVQGAFDALDDHDHDSDYATLAHDHDDYPVRSGSADPTTSDIAAGRGALWLNTTSGELRQWANRGGTMYKSAQLTDKEGDKEGG